MPAPVDLRSDTVTRPTVAMKQAMLEAPLGDDVFGDDPTVRRLEELAAARLGKEAALFVPSGTMGNQVALRCHTRPGDLVLMPEDAHIYWYEAGAPAVISGVLTRRLPTACGLLLPEAIAPALPPAGDLHFAPARLLCVENTANRGGGTVYSLARLDAITAIARAQGLATHLDGARIFNAEVASGVPAARLARDFDTVTFCLSKGLGAPVGSVLCGPAELMVQARRVRKMLGGGMRQAGILAAAGVWALEHHVARLADDHARARRLWEGLRELGLAVEQAPESNMVFARVPDAHATVAALAAEGVRIIAFAADRIRLVTHLDVDDEGVAGTLAAFARLGAAR
ncbi:MAG: low-specificity L-threonine aldolase [Pseudomonadota bacterium]